MNNVGKAIYLNTALIPDKATRTAGGVAVFDLKKNQIVADATRTPEGKYKGYEKCKKIKIPATGSAVEKIEN